MEIKVFDEHHEAFLFWEEAVLRKKIKKGSILLHVDFHDDLGVPYLTESVYTKNLRRFTQNQLSIGNFIIPSILRGTIKKVFSLSPYGVLKQKNIKVASLRGEGIYIIQKNNLNKNEKKFFPDAKICCCTRINNINKVKEQDVILDIDLDYFSCNLFARDLLQLKLTKDQIKHINQFSTSNDDYKINLRFRYIKNGILRSRAFTSEDNLIYNDSREWIDYSIKSFVKSLNVKPKLISICRSVKSGFTPEKYASFIEKTLIKYLNNPPNALDLPKNSSFEIFPFIGSTGNIIYNAYTKRMHEIQETGLFFWKEIRKGRSFSQILKNTLRDYETDEKMAKKYLLDFIFFLKKQVIIK